MKRRLPVLAHVRHAAMSNRSPHCRAVAGVRPEMGKARDPQLSTFADSVGKSPASWTDSVIRTLCVRGRIPLGGMGDSLAKGCTV
jgi:hypothetical protein